MLSISPTTYAKSLTCAASVFGHAELVRKIETSQAIVSKKRISRARKKLSRVIKEHRRYARIANLRAVAMTLTYSCASDFSPKHISALLDGLRRTLKRTGHNMPYGWVLERAGQLHYHVIVWLPQGYKFDLSRLEKKWPWGSTWVESCHSVKAWGRYIAKFNSSTLLPKGVRIFGYGGLDEEGKAAVVRAGMPRWLLRLLPYNQLARRCVGGGWLNSETGEIYRSPYRWTPKGIKLRGTCPINGRTSVAD